MDKTGFLNGLTGALGLYTGVKSLFDSADAARKQRRLFDDARAEESSWFRRNYYGNYLNSSMARAAMKRVEKTMHSQNRMNRAYAAVNGVTPELALARNEQGLRSMDNVVGGLLANDDARRERVELQHRQNVNALRNQRLAMLQDDEQVAGRNMLGGAQLVKNALLGANWGKQSADDVDNEVDNKEKRDGYDTLRWDWG